jgi:hypothetical protein
VPSVLGAQEDLRAVSLRLRAKLFSKPRPEAAE